MCTSQEEAEDTDKSLPKGVINEPPISLEAKLNQRSISGPSPWHLAILGTSLMGNTAIWLEFNCTAF